MSTACVTRLAEEYAARRQELPGTGARWLDEARETAMSQFTELGFPGPRQEAWKYTRLSALEKRPLKLAPDPARAEQSHKPIIGQAVAGFDSVRLVFVNGHFDPQRSRIKAVKGLHVYPLANALNDTPDRVKPYLDRGIQGLGTEAEGKERAATIHPFDALNTALLQDGALIVADEKVTTPVELVYVTENAEDLVINTRVIVAAADNAELCLVERFEGFESSAYFNNLISDIHLGREAKLVHCKLQAEGPRAFHLARLNVKQDAGSKLCSHLFNLGGQLARQEIHIELGEQSHTELNGLFLGQGRQHLDQQLNVEHARPGATSSQVFKGILDGRARGVFNGRIHVHPDAQHTDARQNNNNLLLSRDAEVNTKPQLEIYADDVKCAHGATVGQLDEQMLFYLRSRGIDESSARNMLTHGFAQEMFDQIEEPALRTYANQLFANRMPGAELMAELGSSLNELEPVEV